MQTILNVFLLLYCAPIIIFYFLLCFTIPFLRIGEIDEKRTTIKLYISKDPIHSDYVFDSSLWSEIFPKKGKYIKIGWGDRKIFLETKTWANLNALNVVSAFFGINKTVLRVESLEELPTGCSEYNINDRQLHVLKIHVLDSFFGGPIKKQSWHCEKGDFYESKLRYNCITNCNNWVNRGMFLARITNRIWCPLSIYL